MVTFFVSIMFYRLLRFLDDVVDVDPCGRRGQVWRMVRRDFVSESLVLPKEGTAGDLSWQCLSHQSLWRWPWLKLVWEVQVWHDVNSGGEICGPWKIHLKWSIQSESGHFMSAALKPAIHAAFFIVSFAQRNMFLLIRQSLFPYIAIHSSKLDQWSHPFITWPDNCLFPWCKRPNTETDTPR